MSLSAIQPTSASPLLFAGTQDVKRNLILAAQASAAYVDSGDRFSLGQANTYATLALEDPDFTEVAQNPAGLLDESITVAVQSKATLGETLQTKRALAVLHDVLKQSVVYAGPDARETLEVSIPIKDAHSIREAYGDNPGRVAKSFAETLAANAFRADGPYKQILALLESFTTALQRQLEDTGIKELPIFQKPGGPISDDTDWS